VAGLTILVIGLLWPWLSKLPLGRLPGDILVEREGFRLYVPLTTSILLSLVVSLLVWFYCPMPFDGCRAPFQFPVTGVVSAGAGFRTTALSAGRGSSMENAWPACGISPAATSMWARAWPKPPYSAALLPNTSL